MAWIFTSAEVFRSEAIIAWLRIGNGDIVGYKKILEVLQYYTLISVL
jgi:hypothetical protein